MTQPTLFSPLTLTRTHSKELRVDCLACDDTIVTTRDMNERRALALAENTHKCGWRERVGLPKLRDI